MNKLKLIDAISKESGLSKSDALKAMDAFLSISIRTLKKGEKIMLKDFGTFHVVKRAARTARNINTNKEIKVISYFQFSISIDLHNCVCFKIPI